jgi:hypothetical protein
MNTFILILFRPIKALNQLKIEPFSIMSFIVVLILLLLNLILSIPFNEKILQLTVSSMSLPQNQLDMVFQMANKMRYLQVAGTGILYIIMFLFYALLLYVFVRLSKDKLDYKKALQLLVCCYMTVAIGDIINTILIYMRGIDSIKHIYDTSLTGLNLLTSVEQIGATGYIFLSYINPFQLWLIVLLSIGLKIFANMKPIKAIIISFLFWLITILIPVISVYFSQLTIAKRGIM